MSSVESIPGFLPPFRDSATVEVASLNESNATLRKQRRFLIDCAAKMYKNLQNTSEMLAKVLSTIKQMDRDTQREIAEKIKKRIKSENGVLNESGRSSGESVDLYEEISKMLDENNRSLEKLASFPNLQEAISGKWFVTPQGDDFVVDLDDDEVSLHRPASIISKSTNTGMVVAEATVSRSHLHASLLLFANCLRRSPSLPISTHSTPARMMPRRTLLLDLAQTRMIPTARKKSAQARSARLRMLNPYTLPYLI